MVLTDKQQNDLNQAILGYLKSCGYEGTAKQFVSDLGMDAGAAEELDEKFAKLLEKKWTAIVRLQRKISQLETQCRQLQEDLALYGRGKKLDKTEALPREPAKYTLPGHRMPVTKVLFHPTYNTLLSAGEDSSILLWDYESGTRERSLKGHTDAVQDLCFNTDGTMLATCSADMSIKLWSWDSYQCVKTLNGHDHNVSSVAFLPSGNALVSASRDKTLKLWDTATGYCTKTLKGHDAWVRCVRVSPDGALLASCSMDQTIRLWNLKTGECVRTLRDHDHVIETIEFSNSARVEANIKAMVAGEQAPELKAPATRKEMLEDEKNATGAYLVSGARDKTIRIWATATGECVKVIEGHDNWVRSVCFHPSGRYLLSSADDKTIRVWDLTKNCRQARKMDAAHSLFVSTIAWCRATPLLASGGVDNIVKVWECR